MSKSVKPTMYIYLLISDVGKFHQWMCSVRVAKFIQVNNTYFYIFLLVCLFIYFYLFIFLSISSCLSMYIYVSTRGFSGNIYVCFCQGFHLFICLFIYLSFCLSFNPSQFSNLCLYIIHQCS